MTRLPDWLDRLHAYVENVRHQPFNIIEHSCALFAAGCIEAVSGERADQVLGVSVRSERDVLRVLEQFAGVKGLAQRYFGSPMRPPRTARRGDVVIRPGEHGDTLGVCMGDHALFLSRDGLQPRRLRECAGCWRVG